MPSEKIQIKILLNHVEKSYCYYTQLMGQFSALFWKNWLLYKRGPIGACCQFLVPIAAVAFILLIEHLITITTYPQEQYWNNPFINATYQMDGTPSTINPYIDNCEPESVIALTPSGDPLVNLLNTNLKNNNYSTKLFSSDDELDSYVRAQNYGTTTEPICYGITSVSFSAPNFQYKLRFNVSISPSNTQAPPTNQQITSDQALQLTLFKSIANSGYLGINTLINTFILQQFSSSSHIQNTIGPIYQQKFIDDPTYSTLGNSIQILLLLPLLVIYLRQVSIMLSEKQNKIRQTMSIMGMNKLLYYLTWFIRFFVIYAIVHLICSGILAYAFPYINYGIFFLVFILFDIVLIVQGFFIQIFFTRSKIGVVFALVFFVIQYILSFIVTTSDNPTLSVNFISSIVPHIGFILAFRTMLYAQSDQIYLTLTQQKNFYVVLIAVFFFVINLIVYLILTWYLDQVFPNEWGSRKHPLFCCVNNRRKKVNDDELSYITQNSKIQTEQIDQNMVAMEKSNQAIKIRGLTKQFSKDMLAVDKLNVTFYKDQIFALLGHNGAGKTTTISMLTGMLDPTDGYISILGQTDVDSYRKYIGVCPQHDTLYEDLTVYEHLYLFGAFRGLSGQKLKDEIDKLIKDVNLEQKKYEYTKNLSGGQKRRLSVALAFAGNAKVIILDEPTSGMDTSARRYIWDMLQSNKKDKIMILTTHFMDQADYLGDRIGIMGSGKLICCGSSVYLKNKFGVGYNITIVKEKSDTPSEPFINLINKYIAKSTVISDVGSQLAMQLPLNQISKFENLFNELDNNKQKLGFLTYGISITTLQQVFLKVSEQAKTVAQQEHRFRISLEHSKPLIDQRNTQLKQVMIPLQNKMQDTQQMRIFDQSLLLKQKNFVFNFLRHIWATILKRLRVIRRDIKSFIFQLILPVIIIILALLLMRISFIKDFPSRTLNIQTLAQDSSPVKIGFGGTNAAFTNSMASQISNQYNSTVNILTDTQDQNTSSFDLNFLKNQEQQTQYFRGGLFFNPLAGNTYSYSSVINTRAISSSIILPNLATQAIINSINPNNITITAINDPLPRTYQQLSINNTISGFFAAFIFTLAFSFKFASIISFIVKQRSNRSKNQQIVSGINIGSYWLGNFIYDYFLYILLAVFTCLMILAFNIQGLRQQNGFAACWIIFILFGLVYIPFTYIGGFLFSDYGSAQAAWYFFTFVCGGLLPLVTLLLRIVSTNTVNVGNGLAWAFRIIPAFSFGEGLINIGSRVILQVVANQQFTALNMTIALAPIIYLACGALIYPIILLLIQKISSNEFVMRILNRQSSISDTKPPQDSDVIDQQQKALNANPEDFMIVTKNLRKVYRINGKTKYKVAVDNVSFSISEGEVFGLLGVNGAGKTTTFKMLSGDITSTSGQCYLMGISVNHNIQQIRQNLGYCPQFDALVDNLTVRQQIQLYYDLKCLPYKYKTEAIDEKIKQMDLQDYQNKLSGTLSGGNKRKLSVAMAMIGNPKIIFLDEPSTGMDPKARRFMWKVISRIATQKKQSTIILTTHSMEQAEALSTRLSIMVKGNFKCIGTPQHIKSKYGDGFEIEIRLHTPSKQDIKKIIVQKSLPLQIKHEQLQGLIERLKIPIEISQLIGPNKSGGYLLKPKKISVQALLQFYLIEIQVQNLVTFMNENIGFSQILQNYQTYVRLKTKTKINIGKMFGLFEKCREQKKIMHYSIKQASVEQIFNKFAEDQNIQQQ